MKKKHLMLIVLLSFVIMSFVVSCKTKVNNTQGKSKAQGVKGESVVVNQPNSTLIKEIKQAKNFSLATLIILIIFVIAVVIYWFFTRDLHDKINSIERQSHDIKSSVKNLNYTMDHIKDQPKVREVITKEVAKSDPVFPKIDTSKMEEDIQNISKLTMHLFKILEEQKKDNTVIYETITETCQNNKAELAKESQESKDLFDTKISLLELELTELKDNVMKILNYVNPEKDMRFHKLKIYFPERYEIIRKSFDILENSDADLVERLKSFIHEFSFTLGLHALSEDKEQLTIAYNVLNDILAQFELRLILPMPDEAFEEATMNQEKIFGGSNSIYTVIFPGFATADHVEKALVNVL